MPGIIDFTMGFNTSSARLKNNSGEGFRVYIFGNFSGQTTTSWQQRKIRGIDVDNFDLVMAEIKPALEIGPELILHFETVEEFHPDSWLDKIKLIADLRGLKSQLNNPNTAVKAAEKIKAYCHTETINDSNKQVDVKAENSEDMLQRLLGTKPKTESVQADSVNQFISQIISPYIKKEANPQHHVYIEAIDSMISQYLRVLLHRQDFQNLEALWRSTEMLINEGSSDEHRFFLVDISQAELLSELNNTSATFEQKLMQHIRISESGQDILLVGDYCFSNNESDRDLLKLYSRLAKNCDGLFLGGIDKLFTGNLILSDANNSQNWQQYLNEIDADRVMLTYPRYLLRLPYGSSRDPIESFEFEECLLVPQLGELLWGNTAFLCARVLIRTSQQGNREEQFCFDDIPVFPIELDGEQVLQPGTEELLNEVQANTLISKGVIPLIGFRQRQGVRLINLVPLSEYS